LFNLFYFFNFFYFRLCFIYHLYFTTLVKDVRISEGVVNGKTVLHAVRVNVKGGAELAISTLPPSHFIGLIVSITSVIASEVQFKAALFAPSRKNG
jgi:hypothetical protein